jgi:protein phosphatase
MAARPGDVFFLCSDGMTNYVEEKDILRAALKDGDWDKKLRGLVSEALENGGADNITALFAIIGEEAAR